MERRLVAVITGSPNLSPKSSAAALSLITNPFTSDPTLISIIEALNPHLQNPSSNHNHHKILSLLSAISLHHPRLREHVTDVVRSFVLLPSTSIESIPFALSLLDPAHFTWDESLFLSLCFWKCVKTRRWTLRNLSRFSVRPSVLLTVLLGFTKDPFPYIREAALDGIVLLLSNSGVVVDELSLIEGCCFRTAELLFDAENSVRCAAVRALSEWGQLLVSLNQDESRRDWSDALFIQICSMAREMDKEIRVAAFTALGKIQTVSEDILLQTLSKKASKAINAKSYHGQYTHKLFKIPASASVFTFVRGLDDEFHEVRRSACHALQMLSAVSADFAGEAIPRLMDLLNDDSVAVRLQALESLHYTTKHKYLKVEESHAHVYFGAQVDSSPLIRSAARKTLRSIKLQDFALFKSCFDVLVKNLELYPQDEAELFSVLFKVGRNHGNFVANTIQGASQKLEPSGDGKLDFNDVRIAALLVLAISAPVWLERQICSIPPQIFSYAVTFLGRISRGLSDVMDKNTLMVYLSQCSRFVLASPSKIPKTKVINVHFEDSDAQLMKGCSETSDAVFSELTELKTDAISLYDFQLNSLVTATSFAEFVVRKTVDLWTSIQLGCQREVTQTIRNWKEELRKFTCGSNKPGVVVFALKYLHVIKLLGRVWTCYLSIRTSQFNGIGILEALLDKTERSLRGLLYRFIGLSREDELHILELILLTYTLRLSHTVTCYKVYMEKFNVMLSRVEYIHKEGSISLSQFLVELQNISCEYDHSEDGYFHKFDMFQKSLNLFVLRHFVLPGELNYMVAEMDIRDNDFQNPLPFISGLPVGIPFEITLYNVSSENRLWLTMTLSESTQFVFLDSHEFKGCNDIRKSAFIAPFYKTPKVKYFSLKVSVAMECASDVQHLKHCNGPQHELIHLYKEKEVYLSVVVK